jgi:hypothetical protein
LVYRFNFELAFAVLFVRVRHHRWIRSASEGDSLPAGWVGHVPNVGRHVFARLIEGVCTKMTAAPRIPMLPSELPQQRISDVVALSPRPPKFEFGVGYGPFPSGVEPKQGVLRSPELLVQTEWADTPMNNGVEAFYLQARRKYWLLWLRILDDDTYPCRWDWKLIGYCNRAGVKKEAASTHLLLEYWRFEESKNGSKFGREPYDWINEEGSLSVADVSAIMRELKLQQNVTG